MSIYHHVGIVRKGSRVEYWPLNGTVIEGILEVHPDYPPRIHFVDDRGTVELVPVLEPVMQPPRHEHMPVIAGQEYPRDVSPIRQPDLVTTTRWTLPVINREPRDVRWSDDEVAAMRARPSAPLAINRIK